MARGLFLSLTLIFLVLQKSMIESSSMSFILNVFPLINTTNSSSIKEDKILIEENNQVEFNYKLIGIRSGNEDSSVIVKKGNKEFLVTLGDLLEGSFELVEVNQNDALFRKGQKMYRIERQKDK